MLRFLKGNKGKQEPPKEEPVVPIEQVKYRFENPEGSDDTPEELIAVITAAVAACFNQAPHTLVVRSVRQVPAVAPVWNRAARLDLTSR